LNALEEELHELLVSCLPQGIIGRSHTVAMDLTFIPYHGEACDRAEEIRRGKAKSGTTHFHVYASAYIIRNQKRVTLAVAYWQAHHSLLEVFLRLLLRLSSLHVGINRLLLDRQFCTVAMIRCLQACPWQSIMPVPARSDFLKALKKAARRSQTLDYTMRSPTDGEVTFPLHAVCRYARGRRGKHGIECLLFAVIGPPWHGRPGRLANIYRSRFGIETGYRMMNTVRARTSSRDPKLRLLLVIIAFALINLWLTLKWTILAVPRRGGRWQDPDLFRLHRFCNFLRDAIREVRCAVRLVVRPRLSHAVF
jgi:putative transposase